MRHAPVCAAFLAAALPPCLLPAPDVDVPVRIAPERAAGPEETGDGPADPTMNCYAIVAGKRCTADGSVLYAHNEDSGTGRAVQFFKVPRQTHPKGAQQKLVGGGTVPYAPKTHSYLWCQMPGLRYSDSYLNEHGVAVASNGCHSREDKPDLTDGGITFLLRRIVAARATTARHGMEIAAALLAKFGYADTGRTLIVADGEEAWLMNIARGKHWVAARVPDDKCAVIANHFTIHQIDLADSDNFRASPGVVDYAKKRGWYDPQRDGAFDFATIFGTDGARQHGSNIRRAWRGNNLLSKKQIAEQWLQPTFIAPEKKLEVHDLMEILRDHYCGTKYDATEGYAKGSPYGTHGPTICAGGTSFSTIFQLRADLPPDIGAVMWIAMCRPDASVFVPWYCGITEVPPGFAHVGFEAARRNHFAPTLTKRGPPPGYRAVHELQTTMEPVYGRFFPRLDRDRDALEASILGLQDETESTAQRMHAEDPQSARDYLTSFTRRQHARAGRLVATLRASLRSVTTKARSPESAARSGDK